MKITPTDEQWAAVRAIVAWYLDPNGSQIFYLAGYAGVGKSTIYRLVLEELAKHGCHNVVTCAYTGKAASVLRRKGTPGAMTCHGALYTVVEDERGKTTYALNEFGPAAEAHLIGIDEGSMIDDDMADDFTSFGKRILVMADPGQLPPVKGQGAFTNGEPDVFLREVHRQAADSPILRLATMARKGERIPIDDYGDLVKVMKLTKETAEYAYRDDTQTICGVHMARMKITAEIRARRNYVGGLPMDGERLMCMKNDRTLGIYNGQQGDLLSVKKRLSGSLAFTVKMDDVRDVIKETPSMTYHFDKHFHPDIEYPRGAKGQAQFDWGYVLTAHKAQGSEWRDVTIVDDSGAFRDDRARWLYTAITRASERLTLLKRTT